LLVVLLSFIAGWLLRGVLRKDVPWDRGLVGGRELPLIRQSQPASCGPAALAMVANAWGISTSERELIFLAQTNSVGTTLSNLVQAGNFIGLDIYGLKLSASDLVKANKPLIAYINSRHGVVIEHATSKEVSIIDPAYGGRKRLPITEFSRMWKGASLVVVGKKTGKSPFITDWLITGPYEKEQPLAALLGNQKLKCSLRSPTTSSYGRKTNGVFRTSRYLIDLVELLGQHEEVVAYAKTFVYSPRKQHVQFKIGSDDGIAVWLNGEQLLNVDAERRYALEQERVKATLQRGANRILLKITQRKGQWGFIFRITDEKGESLQNLLVDSAFPSQSE